MNTFTLTNQSCQKLLKMICGFLILGGIVSSSCGPSNYLIIGDSKLPLMENVNKVIIDLEQIRQNIGTNESMIYTTFSSASNVGDVGVLNLVEALVQDSANRVYKIGYIYSEHYYEMEKVIAVIECKNGKIVSVNSR